MRIRIEHEGIDGHAALGAFLHRPESRPIGRGRGRIGEVGASILQVRRGFAVRDHDDLLGAHGVLGEQPIRQQQRVLHVRAEHVFVPLQKRQVVRLELLRVGGEADDVERILGKAGSNEIVQRQGHFLRRLEGPAQSHRPGKIHEHRRRRGGDEFGAIDLEILMLQGNGRLRPVAVDRVADGARHVQVERIAELVGFRLFQAFAEPPLLRQRMVAEALAPQAGVDFAERLLPDHARSARREFPLVARLPHVARLLQRVEQRLQIVEGIRRFVIEHVPKKLAVDALQIAAPLRRLHLADEFVERAHFAHEPHGRFEVDLFAAAEAVAASAGIERRHALGQLLQFRFQLRIVEAVRKQRLQLLALIGGERVHQRLRRGHLLRHLLDEFVEGLGRIGAEHVAELAHEVAEVGLQDVRVHPLRLHRHQFIERAQHLLHALHVAGRHFVHHLLDVVEERLRHGLAQFVQQLQIRLLRFGIQKLVILQLLHLAGRVFGQFVQRLAVLLGDLLEDLVREGVLLRRLVLAQPLIDGLALHVQDVVQLALDVLEEAGEIEALQLRPLAVAQALENVAQSLPMAAFGDRHAPRQQVAHGPAQIAVGHQVVHHLAEHLVRADASLLAAVPLGEAVARGKVTHGR